MSYHILHQFDEQWLAELSPEDKSSKREIFGKSNQQESTSGRAGKFIERESNRWIIVAAAMLMATFALLFALDASRRAETLQQRVDQLESTMPRR